MSRPSLKLVIIDANVLIDFADTNQETLGLLAKTFERYVPKLILNEVDGFDENTAMDTGLFVCHPTLDELTEAALRLLGLSAQGYPLLQFWLETIIGPASPMIVGYG